MTTLRPSVGFRPAPPVVPTATLVRHIEIDGITLGPDFVAGSEGASEDTEIVHRWMVNHHPDTGYSIVSMRLGHCCRRASYAAAVRPVPVDYGVW
jgi:hypothetical protein